MLPWFSFMKQAMQFWMILASVFQSKNNLFIVLNIHICLLLDSGALNILIHIVHTSFHRSSFVIALDFISLPFLESLEDGYRISIISLRDLTILRKWVHRNPYTVTNGERNMWKISVTKVMSLLILVSLSSFVTTVRLDYGEHMCPLSRHNIRVAEELMETVQELLEKTHEQSISTADEETLVNEAEQSLQKARIYSLRSQNCITGNFFAIKAQSLLKTAKEMLDSKLVMREEEYAVYRAFIDSGFYLIKYKYDLDEVQLLVIDNYTSADETGTELDRTLQWVSQEMAEVNQETLENFRIKNAGSHLLDSSFNLTVEVLLISDEEVREIFQKGGWEGFYAKYPFSQGIMTLSRVGFNIEMNQALLYVANEADDSVGGGYYILFAKVNGIWDIQEWVISWVY